MGKLYIAKLRALDKAIPILLADPADLALVARDVQPGVRRLAERFWPGPLTLVVPRSAQVPDEVTAGGDSVAVRVPDHDLARALIRAAGAPLATTSANLSGGPSPVTAQEVAAQLAGRIALILDGGRCPGGMASTVVDLTGPIPASFAPGRSAWKKSWKLCYNPVMLIGIDASRAVAARRTGTETYSLHLICT